MLEGAATFEDLLSMRAKWIVDDHDDLMDSGNISSTSVEICSFASQPESLLEV